MVEEQSGDDGVFADFDKINKQEVNARIKEIQTMLSLLMSCRF